MFPNTHSPKPFLLFFLVFFTLSYFIKPFLFLFPTPNPFWIFNSEYFSANTFFSFFLSALFLIFLIFGYKIRIKIKIPFIIHYLLSPHFSNNYKFLFAAISPLALLPFCYNSTNSLLVISSSTGLIACCGLLWFNSGLFLKSYAFMIFVSNLLFSVKSRTPLLYIIFFILIQIPYFRKSFLRLSSSNLLFSTILFSTIFFFIIGFAQIARWSSYSSFDVMGLNHITSGYATTFDQLDTLNTYLDRFGLFPRSFGYWLGDLLILFPRYLFDKPIEYGSLLISRDLWGSTFELLENGSGAGQYPLGIIVHALDFCSFYLFAFYAIGVGIFIRILDCVFQAAPPHIFAITLFLFLNLNSLVRAGILQFIIYNLVFALSFMTICFLSCLIVPRFLSLIRSP